MPFAPGHTPAKVTRERKAKRAERLARVLEWVCAGVPAPKIISQTRKDYNVGLRQAQIDLNKVREEMLPEIYSDRHRRGLVVESIARAERHYIRCCSDKQHGPGLATLKHICDLYGIGGAISKQNRAKALADRIEQMRLEAISKAEATGSAAGMHRVGAVGGNSAPLEQANQMRQMYGLDPFDSVDEYNEFLATQKRAQMKLRG